MIDRGGHRGTRRKSDDGYCLRVFLRPAWFILLFAFATLMPLSAFLAPDDVTLEKAAEQKTPDTELFLKYQSHEADYLIFYDKEGSTLLVKYRIDRWDYDNDTMRDALRQGITYKVKMQGLKKLGEGEIPKGVSGSGLPPTVMKRKIRRIRDLYSGEFLNINESALRDLRY